jgi:hypothetical protein
VTDLSKRLARAEALLERIGFYGRDRVVHGWIHDYFVEEKDYDSETQDATTAIAVPTDQVNRRLCSQITTRPSGYDKGSGSLDVAGRDGTGTG